MREIIVILSKIIVILSKIIVILSEAKNLRFQVGRKIRFFVGQFFRRQRIISIAGLLRMTASQGLSF